jgi:phospholipase C
MHEFNRYTLSLCAIAVMLAGCGGAASPPGVPGEFRQSTARDEASRSIQNVIVVIQQNRSFDNLFSGFAGADAPTKGLTSKGTYVPLRPIRLQTARRCAANHRGDYFQIVYDGGKMDGWNLLDGQHPLCPYTHVARAQVQPYWDLAQQYVLADKMFASTKYGDFVNSLYLVAGTARVKRNVYLAGQPNNTPWGCDAPAGTWTPVLKHRRFDLRGPFPCFDQFPTIADLLDKANVSWRFYYGDAREDEFPFNPYTAIEDVVDGPDWAHDMSAPATNILGDLTHGNLASVSWVLSPLADSDNPGYGGGPKWVSALVRAVQKSAYWQHSAIVVVWDDPGAGLFYDNAAPPQLDEMGLGFRVPMIVVSPYAKRGYVSHVQYEFGSILKFIEENWKLGSLGSTDRRANGFTDIFKR